MVQHDPDVDAWFDRYDNPQKELVRAVRDVMLAADSRVGECIKWQAPTFTYQGNIASSSPRPRSTHHGLALRPRTQRSMRDGCG